MPSGPGVDYDRLGYPISIKRVHYAHYITTSPLGFSDPLRPWNRHNCVIWKWENPFMNSKYPVVIKKYEWNIRIELDFPCTHDANVWCLIINSLITKVWSGTLWYVLNWIHVIKNRKENSLWLKSNQYKKLTPNALRFSY